MKTLRGTGGGLLGSNHVRASNELTVEDASQAGDCQQMYLLNVNGDDCRTSDTAGKLDFVKACKHVDKVKWRPTFLPEASP